jgi:hypothetical protein
MAKEILNHFINLTLKINFNSNFIKFLFGYIPNPPHGQLKLFLCMVELLAL